MKKMYSFLFYKLYRFAKAQEETVGAEFGFICYAFVFEILHLAIIFGFIDEFFNYNLKISLPYVTTIILLVLLSLINYVFFIKSKLIHNINSNFQNRSRVVWKDNICFFCYIFFLFSLILFLTWYHQEYNVNN